MTEGSLTNQYITTIWVNLISIAYGAACGWSSSAFLVLQSDDCPFEDGPITSEQASWIGSILCVGGLLGTLVFGWLADRYGRKLAGCLVAIPQILGWVCIIVANNYYYLILARFWAGFAGGGTFVIIPLYVAEISEDRVRGTLGSMLVLSCNFGLLASFLGGNYLSYEALPWALLPLPLVFLAGFIFMPESPPFLMKINKYEESEKALRFFRGCRRVSQPVSEQFKIEMVKLKSNYNDDKSMIADGKIAFADFKTKPARRAILIGISLMALNQFCGCFAMLNYTGTIFAESGSNLTPNMSAVVIGVIQIIGAYISTILVDRAGRKILLSVSAGGTGIGLAIMSGYSYLKYLEYDISSYRWIPLASFSFVIFIASWGVLTLPFVVLAEIMPQKIKGFATTFCMSILWIFAFVAIKYFSTLFDVFGMHGTMLLFSICSLLGMLFVVLIVPETKGKSFDEIIKLLN